MNVVLSQYSVPLMHEPAESKDHRRFTRSYRQPRLVVHTICLGAYYEEYSRHKQVLPLYCCTSAEVAASREI
jgi:hypothetical protein